MTVPLSAVLDRLARSGPDDVYLPVPPMTLRESSAGVGAPRGGWEPAGTVPDAELRRAAEEGIREIAGIIPDKPGALIVNNARATVWGRPLPAAHGLPAGTAFAALTLGFLAEGEHSVFRRRHVVPAQQPPRPRAGPSGLRPLAGPRDDALAVRDGGEGHGRS